MYPSLTLTLEHSSSAPDLKLIGAADLNRQQAFCNVWVFTDANQLPQDDLVSQWHARSWCTLPDPPFESRLYTSYVVHLDGQSFFVNLGNLNAPTNFSLHMRNGMGCKMVHGWVLPINGRAHFDPKLDAWVGISSWYSGVVGHLCACNLL